MSDTTTIEWTRATWNPTVGCTQISPRCAHCYAKTARDRRHKAFLAGKVLPLQYAKPFETLQTIDRRLFVPLDRKKPQTYFVNSVSDLFHEDVPDEFILQVFTVMGIAKQHTFQILTKRADRMQQLLSSWRADDLYTYWHAYSGEPAEIDAWPLPNVWLGVSVENQHFADERIQLLLQTPASIRFISAEPLLGPIDLSDIPWSADHRRFPDSDDISDARTALRVIGGTRLDWVIVGGGSARPFDVAWARSIVRQCQAADVPAFVKQLGALTVCEEIDGWPRATRFHAHSRRIYLGDKKGGDMLEWPEDLRVRQMPAVRS